MTNGTSTRPITIVIPLYGDIESSKVCIESVLEFGDLGQNQLLIVNDCGPEVESMELMVRDLTRGLPSISYVRNPQNLGFVESCNKAVFEYDKSENDVLLLNSDAALTSGAIREMAGVLNADEKHGIVHPRSNEATIASVPILPLNDRNYSFEESASVYKNLKERLPRWTITPVAVGFCFLFRRQLANNYGLFDDVYSPGYSEENDFCWRVNRLGYSALLANHAYVTHLGSRSFSGPERQALVERNNAILVDRYPHHLSSVPHYLQFVIEPADWFADRLFGSGRKKILIDLFHMSLVYNGSTRNALSFLEVLAKRAPERNDIEFTIVSSAEAIEFFDLQRFGISLRVNGTLEETYDLGFALSPVADQRQINVLNRHCVRWVVCHFDIIALRVNTLLEHNFTRRQVVLDSLIWAERVVSISESSIRDLESYFGPVADDIRDHTTVLLEGVVQDPFRETSANTGFGQEADLTIKRDNFVLVIGNQFPHKHFPEALNALVASDIGLDVVAFGKQNESEKVQGVVAIEAGHLSDDQVRFLYAQAKCVVFPSTYEGFGLPTVEVASLGNRIVLFESAVSHEVAEELGIAENVRYFSLLRELPSIVAEVSRDSGLRPIRMRTLDEYNNSLFDIVMGELEKPVDIPRLERRVWSFRRVEVYADSVETRLSQLWHQHHLYAGSTTARLAQLLTHMAHPIKPVLRPLVRVTRQLRQRLK